MITRRKCINLDITYRCTLQCSKCNREIFRQRGQKVPGHDMSMEEFKKIYTNAWKGKLKGVTTFRLAGKRYGILNKVDAPTKDEQGAACFYDPETGKKECDL